MSHERPLSENVMAIFAGETDERGTTYGVFVGGLHPEPWQRQITPTEHARMMYAIGEPQPGPGELCPVPDFRVEKATTGPTGWWVTHPEWCVDAFGECSSGVVSEHSSRDEADWVCSALNLKGRLDNAL